MSFRLWVARHKVAVGVGAGVVVAVAAVLAVILAVVFASMNNSKPWETEVRLPESVVPVSYDLLLYPDIESGTFTGSEDIQLHIQEDRDYFVFHAKYLDITKATLKSGNGTKSIDIEDWFEVSTAEWWVIKPTKGKIPQGQYVLHLEWSGSLTKNNVGFYRSVYTTSDDDSRYIATTKFEPTYARLAFPCFDEPAMKATFSVKLVRPTSGGYLALSNANVESEHVGPGPGLTTVQFHTTVKMSTYLAAFIVCDFAKQSENVTTNGGVPVNVYARSEQINNMQVALKTAVNALNFYVDFFNIPYPMPKVDLVAIPDFVSGAMENWGLITFRETSILFDPDENAPINQQNVCITVAHELAHMWFGNLVTMAWWTDLWLNEGFATFMSYKSLNKLYPDWDMLGTFAMDTLEPVLQLDAVLSSHPVLQVVTNPDQITEIFDTISYNKGSSVIRMLEFFMTESNFAKGLNRYLTQHQYSNAETVDLWTALQEFAPSGVDVAAVMNTWTLQTGFPLVTVKQEAGGKYTVSQKRFLADRNASYDPSESVYRYKWEVPISFKTNKGNDYELVWLKSDVDNASIVVDAGCEWIKLNYLQKGYYRVLYDDETWKLLIAAITNDTEVLEPVDRASLISDAFNLADAEEMQFDAALDLTLYLSKEKSFLPWYAASDAVKELLNYLPDNKNLKKYGQSLLTPIYNELGWNVDSSDSFLTRRLRGIILDLACSLELDSALTEAKSQFVSWLNGGDKPTQDVRSAVYNYGLKSNSSELWHNLLEKYLAESNTQEKAKLMRSLATTTSEELLTEFIELAKNETIIRTQDYFSALGYIASNPKGEQLVWDFYRNEYEYLVNRFSLNDRTFGRFIRTVTQRFSTAGRLQELKNFLAKNPEAGAGTTARQQALEMVSNNIKWLTRNKNDVENWLSKTVASVIS